MVQAPVKRKNTQLGAATLAVSPKATDSKAQLDTESAPLKLRQRARRREGVLLYSDPYSRARVGGDITSVWVSTCAFAVPTCHFMPHEQSSTCTKL